MSEKKTVVIACRMIEDEINNALEELDTNHEIVWLDRGYHKFPDDLRDKLQEEIDKVQDADEILLAYGLCGKGTEGLVSRKAKMVIPRFDDCTNMLLCTGKRKKRGLTSPDTMYLTQGWTFDDDAILNQYEIMKEKYDEETAAEITEMMFEHYRYVAAIDDGCYDTSSLKHYMEQVEEIVGLEPKVVEGSNQVLVKLLKGEWDENFVVLEAGKVLGSRHFDFAN